MTLAVASSTSMNTCVLPMYSSSLTSPGETPRSYAMLAIELPGCIQASHALFARAASCSSNFFQYPPRVLTRRIYTPMTVAPMPAAAHAHSSAAPAATLQAKPIVHLMPTPRSSWPRIQIGCALAAPGISAAVSGRRHRSMRISCASFRRDRSPPRASTACRSWNGVG